MRPKERQWTVPDGYLLTVTDYRDVHGPGPLFDDRAEPSMNFPHVRFRLERSGLRSEFIVTDQLLEHAQANPIPLMIERLFYEHAKAIANASTHVFDRVGEWLKGDVDVH